MDFFDPNSKFSQIMGTVFDYAKLGLMALVLCVPVITAGAAVTAAMSVGMKIAREEAPGIWKPFWSSFRENFRQSLPLTLLVAGVYGLLSLDFWYLMQMDSTLWVRIARAGTFIAAALGSMIALYLFPLLARYKLTNRQIIRNAAAYALINFPKNLLAIGILLLGMWLMSWAIPLFPVILLATPAVLVWYMSRVCVRTFRRVEDRQGSDGDDE